ncbi:T9SS type A sorting domain-containing protein [Hymenobacter negativus]|uniref:T9SS type A sorting domain-containing protein n=1 Tax=Hymenobacter negativus TaxID=2795026 RepID=A0ABS3QF60_9BACT|nr:T9SS type A sorting domain-containing protein [Hymenobacter negativus]MBO2009633.1 T9SS type A sorting domain-containing protein [Hymenobacter negativus]
MKTVYYREQLLLLVILLVTTFGAHAQQAWRPFQPGLIYTYDTAPVGSVTPNTFLLRLDSAYATPAGDSAWAFNRLMRPLDGSAPAFYTSARKSRNNLFGARLLWTPGTSEFVLENVAEGTYQAALSLRLRPRAAVGSTWTASTAPLLTATLSSRAWQPVTSAAGSPSDSVATITLSSGAVLRLSRRYGLLAAPRWLAVGNNTAPQWQVSELPAPLAGTPLSPVVLFNFQPGDRLGYETTPISMSGPRCTTDFSMRVIQSRQVTSDSLIYTYQEQTRTVNYSGLGCFSTPGAAIGPVRAGRMAFSLRNGRSPQYQALVLLSGEYEVVPNRSGTVVVGTGLRPANGAGCLNGRTLFYQQLYPTTGGTHNFPTDYGWTQTFALQLGLGNTITSYSSDEMALTYYQRVTPNGLVTCGSSTDYANLLPTRAAEAAKLATLHPNPATEAATLTLMQPARPGHQLYLTDALGRTVWNAPLSVDQTTVAVPLVGQPTGLYMLHLSGPEATGSWKLLHE